MDPKIMDALWNPIDFINMQLKMTSYNPIWEGVPCTLCVLGKTGSGKSIFAATGYACLREGICIGQKSPRISLNPNYHQLTDRQLTSAYKHISVAKKLPDGTSENSLYKFQLTLDDQNICKMQYLDYRGGIRNDKNPEPDEWAQFQEIQSQASMITFVLPADLLQKFENLDHSSPDSLEHQCNSSEIDGEINQIRTQLLYLDECNSKAPLLFYVTKSDLLENIYSLRFTLERLLRSYHILTTARPVLACFSTLGQNIQINEYSQILSGLAPEGFEVPILLTAVYVLQQIGAKSEIQLRNAEYKSIAELKATAAALNEEEKQLMKSIEAIVSSNTLSFMISGKAFYSRIVSLKSVRKKQQETEQMIQKKQCKLGEIRSHCTTEAEAVLTYLAETHNERIFYLNSPYKRQGVIGFFEDTKDIVFQN